MPIHKFTLGTPGEASQPDAIKAAFAEFFSMIIFVFAGQGSGLAFSKFYGLNRASNVLCCAFFFLNFNNLSILSITELIVVN